MKFFTIFLILFLITNPAKAQIEGCSKIYSSLVFDEKTGEILFEKRSDNSAYPASLVKMMTLYLAFESIEKGKLKFDQVLRVSQRGEEIAKVNKVNTLRLKEGDKITVREAIRAVIVKSFNEAAVTLAEAVAGDEWEFVRKMNEKAEKLGMYNTSFRNASGLHEEGQYTNGYDLARLALAIKRDFPGYYHLFALKDFTYNGVKWETHNHVLVDYKGAEGLKTGFTNASGFNLISAATKDGRRVMSVLLGCATSVERDKFTAQLLDNAFERIKTQKKGDLEVKLGKGFDYKNSQIKRDEFEDNVRFGND
jgi:D-alanyl-D-alanine carboxypeptidase